MAEFKLVISDPKTGKSIQKELKDDAAKGLIGKKIGETFKGEVIDLAGYEFQVTGGSDAAGFPMRGDVQGNARKRITDVKSLGVHNKKHKPNPKKKGWRTMKGMRLKKLVAGNTVHAKTAQINLKITKQGRESLFEEAKPAEPEGEAPKEEAKEAPKEEAKPEAPKEEKKETQDAKQPEGSSPEASSEPKEEKKMDDKELVENEEEAVKEPESVPEKTEEVPQEVEEVPIGGGESVSEAAGAEGHDEAKHEEPAKEEKAPEEKKEEPEAEAPAEDDDESKTEEEVEKLEEEIKKDEEEIEKESEEIDKIEDELKEVDKEIEGDKEAPAEEDKKEDKE